MILLNIVAVVPIANTCARPGVARIIVPNRGRG